MRIFSFLLTVTFAVLLVSGCSTTPSTRKKLPDDFTLGTPDWSTAGQRRNYGTKPSQLIDQLGMRRQISDLGFAEKQFSSCNPEANGVCKAQFFSVVHFQLLCRDSEGSVSNVPIHLTPLTSDQVNWQVAGLTGDTKTDSMGFGQMMVVSDRSILNHRLILRIGKQFMGFTVSEVTKVVLPQNFCL